MGHTSVTPVHKPSQLSDRSRSLSRVTVLHLSTPSQHIFSVNHTFSHTGSRYQEILPRQRDRLTTFWNNKLVRKSTNPLACEPLNKHITTERGKKRNTLEQ